MKNYIIKICILVAYLVILAFLLRSHYVEGEESAGIIYFNPMELWDYCLIVVIGIFMFIFSKIYTRGSEIQRRIECACYIIIIALTIIFGNSILAYRTIDLSTKNIKAMQKYNYIDQCFDAKALFFNLIDECIGTNFTSYNYSYALWVSKTEDLIGLETRTHGSDFDYSRHELYLLDYLNWHLLKQIVNYTEDATMQGLILDIELSNELLNSQRRFILEYFAGYDTRYDVYGLEIEHKTILNDNLRDMYTILTKGMSYFKQRRITTINMYPYECPDVDDELIEKEYLRFTSECINVRDVTSRKPLEIERVTSILANEHNAWERFIAHRNRVEINLSGDLKRLWSYTTKVWKLNKIKQLKNEFECYGSMSELDYKLSLQDCNYIELMNYHSFSSAWENIKVP